MQAWLCNRDVQGCGRGFVIGEDDCLRRFIDGEMTFGERFCGGEAGRTNYLGLVKFPR